MLAELENKGVSLDVIYELSRVLDLQKIAKELSARTDPWSNMGVGLVPNIDIDTPYCRVNRIYNTSSLHNHYCICEIPLDDALDLLASSKGISSMFF